MEGFMSKFEYISTNLLHNEEFNNWCSNVEDPHMELPNGKSVLLMAYVLHNICEGDVDKFSECCRIMHIAFDAGAKSNKK